MPFRGFTFKEPGSEEADILGDVMDVQFIFEQKMKGFKLYFAVELCLLFLLHECVVVLQQIVLHLLYPLLPVAIVCFVYHEIVHHVFLRYQLKIEKVFLPHQVEVRFCLLGGCGQSFRLAHDLEAWVRGWVPFSRKILYLREGEGLALGRGASWMGRMRM